MKKIVVYTSLMGAYDSQLIEIDNVGDRFDFVCFTNMKRLKSNTWTMKYVEQPVKDDNPRSAYYYKTNPHLIFPEYDMSIWMDSSCNRLDIKKLEKMADDFESKGTHLYIEKHPGRNCVYEELRVNIHLKKDDIDAMTKHVESYRKEGMPSDFGLVETGLQFRKHNKKDVIQFQELLWNEMTTKTRRDQLSWNYCAWKLNFTNYSLFTFKEKTDTLWFQDHPHQKDHKEKVLLAGPWLGDKDFEQVWSDHIRGISETTPYDTVIVGCRPNREPLYDYVDKCIISDPEGKIDFNKVNGRPPVFSIKTDGTKDITKVSPTNTLCRKLKEKHLRENGNTVNVFYNFYTDSDKSRDKELRYCLDKLIENENINNIYLITDESPTFPKCKNVKVSERPTYNDIFNIINEKTTDDGVNILVNSDCYLNVASTSKIRDNISTDEAFVLTRKEITSIDPFMYKDMPNAHGSQDAWVFKGKIKNAYANYTMGTSGCDNRLTYDLKQSGYKVYNPTKDIELYHYHTTQIRRYDKSKAVPFPYLMVEPCSIFNKVDRTHRLDSMDDYPEYVRSINNG